MILARDMRPYPRIEFDFSELDQVLDSAEKAIAHSKEMLDKRNRPNTTFLPKDDKD